MERTTHATSYRYALRRAVRAHVVHMVEIGRRGDEAVASLRLTSARLKTYQLRAGSGRRAANELSNSATSQTIAVIKPT